MAATLAMAKVRIFMFTLVFKIDGREKSPPGEAANKTALTMRNTYRLMYNPNTQRGKLLPSDCGFLRKLLLVGNR